MRAVIGDDRLQVIRLEMHRAPSPVVIIAAATIECITMVFGGVFVNVRREVLQAAQVDPDQIVVPHPVAADEQHPQIFPTAELFWMIR